MVSDCEHICIVSHPENLIKVRHALARVLDKTCLRQKETSSLILAVDEACSNIIRHGYNNDHTQTIELKINLTEDKLAITILDKGIEFDIHSVEKRDVSEVRPGGLGIYIIHHVMDSVDYSRTPEGKNRIDLIKWIKSDKEP